MLTIGNQRDVSFPFAKLVTNSLLSTLFALLHLPRLPLSSLDTFVLMNILAELQTLAVYLAFVLLELTCVALGSSSPRFLSTFHDVSPQSHS